MWYLVHSLWLSLAIALVLGLAVGWLTASREPSPWFSGWVPGGLVVAALGLLAAILQLLPGRLGLWLDSALLLTALYIIGCFLGWLARGYLGREPVLAGMAPAVSTSPVARSPAPDTAPAPGFIAPPPSPPRASAAAVTPPPAASAPAPGFIVPAQPSPAAAPPFVAPPLVAPPPVPDRAPAPGFIASPGPAPAAAPPLPDEDKHEGKRPAGLVAPRGGVADDLKRVRGIGNQNEGRLHSLGIWHFAQIAAWTPEEISWVGSFLTFHGRIEREDWVGQARQLARGAETEFSRRVARGEVATSKDDGSQGQANVAPDPKRE